MRAQPRDPAGRDAGTHDAAGAHVLRIAISLTIVGCATSPDDEILDELAAAAPAPPAADAVAAACPGFDAGAPTYRGLAGTYRRFDVAPAAEPIALMFAPVRDDPDAVGTFAGTRAALPAFYAGGFHALPDNPAIGAIIGFDTNADGKIDQSLFVLGLRRSPTGALAGLCLGGVRPFAMTRTVF
jgi:hypothetical protein